MKTAMASLAENPMPAVADTLPKDTASPSIGIQTKAKKIVEDSDAIESKKRKAVDEGTGQTNGLIPHAELKALGVRQYLEKTVVPVLLQGMQELVKTRPEDPFESLATFIQENNPRKRGKLI